MNDVRFRSDIEVAEVDCSGGDWLSARAAWVVKPGADCPKDTPAGRQPVLNTCVKLHHNTPIEHGLMVVYAEMPGVVWWQLTRHRFMSLDSEDFSFSIESGRYRHLDPEFYLPPDGRPCAEPEGFKPMRPSLSDDHTTRDVLKEGQRTIAEHCWEMYQTLITRGVAREVARLVLPNWMIYCDGFVSGRLSTWLQLFMKRRPTPSTEVVTFPQWEIEEFTRKCESVFAAKYPGIHSAFERAGRVAP